MNLISLVDSYDDYNVGDDGFCVGIACAVIDCVQGTCKDSSSFLGFECECYPGWKAIQIGYLTFPACVIPNCESLSLISVSLTLSLCVTSYNTYACRYEVTLCIVNTSVFVMHIFGSLSVYKGMENAKKMSWR